MTYSGPTYNKEAWRASVVNGKILPGKLAQIEAWPVPFDRDLNGPAMAHPEAASAMGVLLRTAWAAGHRGLTISLSYRTYAFQLLKWEDFQKGGNLAAQPGTSNHGWGVAFDMHYDTDDLAWLKKNAATFGFRNDVPSEPWHWVLYENEWDRRNDMTEEELTKLNASADFVDGDRLFRAKYSEKDKDPGPPPENFPPAKRQGWSSARFPVRLMDEHEKGHASA